MVSTKYRDLWEGKVQFSEHVQRIRLVFSANQIVRIVRLIYVHAQSGGKVRESGTFPGVVAILGADQTRVDVTTTDLSGVYQSQEYFRISTFFLAKENGSLPDATQLSNSVWESFPIALCTCVTIT